jgi:hypothetical protein
MDTVYRKESIFQNTDIDTHLLQYFDLISDYPHVKLINRYYHNLIINDDKYMLWLDLQLNYVIFCDHNDRPYPKYVNLFMNACRRNNKLYHYYINNYTDLKHYLDFAFNQCSTYSTSPEAAEWLLELSHQPGFTPIKLEYHFISSCISGNLIMAKWMIEQSKTGQLINIHTMDEYAFSSCCQYERLEMLEWLIELSRQPEFGLINIHTSNETAFRISCSLGYLKVAQWLIELSRQPEFGLIDIHVNNDNIFYSVCTIGHVEVVQWLIELSRLPEFGQIDIHTLNVFYMSCVGGHLRIAKMLIQLSQQPPYTLIDIHADNDMVFYRCCLENQVAVARWLIKLSRKPQFGPINIVNGGGVSYTKTFAYCQDKGYGDMVQLLKSLLIETTIIATSNFSCKHIK